MIRSLARALPHQAPTLERFAAEVRGFAPDRAAPLLPPRLSWIVFAEAVLPTMTHTHYDYLAIADGRLASVRYMQALRTRDEAVSRQTFANLRAYCKFGCQPVSCAFGPSLQPLSRPSSLPWPLLTSARLSTGRPPRARCMDSRAGPSDSTQCAFRRRSDFVFPSTLIARTRPRCPFLFVRSSLRSTLLPARQSPAAPWASLARVVVTTSGNLLPDCQSMPMPGTLGLGATLVVARIGEVRFRRQRDGTSPSPTTRCSLHVRVPTRGGEPGWSVQSVMSRCQYSSPSRLISARVASFHDASPT